MVLGGVGSWAAVGGHSVASALHRRSFPCAPGYEGSISPCSPQGQYASPEARGHDDLQGEDTELLWDRQPTKPLRFKRIHTRTSPVSPL